MVDSSVPTHVARARKVPIALKDRAKMKLNQMVAQGIIVPQDAPKDWVSNMVVGEKKKGDLRICIDPKPLNEALRMRHSRKWGVYMSDIIRDFLRFPDTDLFIRTRTGV